jgi:hypothetical protein
MSNTLKIGELAAVPVDNTLVDAKTAPLPTVVTSLASEAVSLPETPAPPPEPERPAGTSAELREFIAMLRRDRKNEVHIRRLKRTAWALAAAATIVYLVHRPRQAPAPATEPVAASPAAFETPPAIEPEPVEVSPPPPVSVEIAAGRPENGAGCEESFARQRWRAAVESCTKVFEEAPSAEVAMHIAHAQWSRGQAGQAGVWARRALQLGNRDADAFVLIGHSEREAGRGWRAAAAYRRYLQSSPRGWHAKRLRAAIRELKRKTAYRQPSAQRSDHVIR